VSNVVCAQVLGEVMFTPLYITWISAQTM